MCNSWVPVAPRITSEPGHTRPRLTEFDVVVLCEVVCRKAAEVWVLEYPSNDRVQVRA